MTMENAATYIVPTIIFLLLVIFFKRARLSKDISNNIIAREQFASYRAIREDAGKDKLNALQEALKRDDVSLRLLEELVDTPRRYYTISYNERGSFPDDSLRLRNLESIDAEIKSSLRQNIASEEFPSIRDRLIKLLDEVRSEKVKLQQKEPFNDIRDPEKSLLIDIFSELPSNSIVARQKVVQLSNIIKIKHQDIAELQEENSRAAGWTKWGTAGTIFFGLLSLFLSLFPFWGK